MRVQSRNFKLLFSRLSKVQFYEELEDAFLSPISRANSVQDIACEEKPKDAKTEHLNSKESEDLTKGLEIMEHNPSLKDERSVLLAPLARTQVEQQYQSLMLKSLV